MEFNKKDIINAKAAAIALKDVETDITVDAIYQCKIKNEEGQEKDGMYLRGTDKNYYCTVSPSCLKSVDDLYDIIVDEGTVTLCIVKRKSSSGREFITLQVR